MEQDTALRITLSRLIHGGQPLTSASSLSLSRPISISHQPHKTSHQNQKPFIQTPQNPKPETLKPLDSSLPLVGILSLPTFPDNNPTITCSCFQFSDDSAVVCCDILDFEFKMMGRKFEILAWNFIPLKCGKNGFLEIVRWSFVQPCDVIFCSLSSLSSFCWSSDECDIKDESKAKSSIFGVIESVSPVFVVPCSSRENGSRNVSGFLVNVLVCECKLCSSKFLVSELENLNKESVEDHHFTKPLIVYFCGSTSNWHPVITRLVCSVVLLCKLKKKLVFSGKKESQLMYVTTDNMSLHILKFKRHGAICNGAVTGEGECRSYTGVITGAYMQGMVVELDQDVMLLLTDQYLTVPHSVRVGAIVTVENVHFVDPKFSWGKMLILGACCRTSVCVESFSPLRSGCYLRSYSPSLLQKFIDSLSFAARLWVLLAISCFRRKFAGSFSEKEILGSKHKEGLVQKYATSLLPPAAFQSRHGVLPEFCKHDFCSGGKKVQCGVLKLVIPIANLIGYCEVAWKNFLDDCENRADFMGGTNRKGPLSCGGRFYEQSMRRFLQTEEIGFLVLGTLKVCSSSGRLQLVDATGGLDIMLDLPATWDFDGIFEAKNFVIVMEGVPQKSFDLNLIIDHPISLRSIFGNTPLVKRMKPASVYLYYDPSDEDARNYPLFFNGKRNFKELESGKYHLIMLTHKFPFRRKYQGVQANKMNMFAEAIVLPWDLLVSGKHKGSVLTVNNLRGSHENFSSHKRCKIDQAPDEASYGGFSGDGNGLSGQQKGTIVSNGLIEEPCVIASNGFSGHFVGILRCTSEHAKISVCKLPRSKILLEFDSESFYTYEVLKIGCCYLSKHQKDDRLCSAKENNQLRGAKIFFTSGTNFWNLKLSSMEDLRSSDISNISSFLKSHLRSDDGTPNGLEIPCLTRNDFECAICSDINLFVPATALNPLVNFIKNILDDPFEPKDSLKEESNIDGHGGVIKNGQMQSSGPLYSDYLSPVGNLISLHGLVMGLHECNGNAFPALSSLIPGEDCLPIFLRGNSSVCVHLQVEHCTVNIICDPSKQAYPVGLGRDVYATFHRILVLSGQNKYMMMPMSFITIDDIGLTNGHSCDESNSSSRSVGSQNVASPSTVPTTLVFDVLQFSQLQPMQFRCRVVAVYMIILEKTKTRKHFQLSVHSGQCVVGIPLAGFIMDDGSSSCCCWADTERAATLLGVNHSEDCLHEASAENFVNVKKTGTGRRYSSSVGRLNRILKQHGRIVAKNYGSIHDSSFQDLAFSFCSDKSISCSDEDFLTTLLTNPSYSTFWTVTGSIMNPTSRSQLEGRLTELDMTMPPLQNVWITNVCCTDMLSEARNIMEQLL